MKRVDSFERRGRQVVLLTRREATALEQLLEAVFQVGPPPDDQSDLARARRVLRNQLDWLVAEAGA